jgi:taurine dioxygenase
MSAVLERSPALDGKFHQNIRVRKYKPLIGAVIENLDLTRTISEDNRVTLNRALVDHGVIFIREQKLSPEQHVAFARLFGNPIRKNIYLPAVAGFPEIEVIAHSEKTLQSGGTDNWHVDVSWQVNPPKATVLHAQEIPEGGGGDTLWSSSAAVYDLLDPDLARYFEKLKAVNTFFASPKKQQLSDLLSGYDVPDGKPETVEDGLARVLDASIKFPPIEVPVIKTHPENGRKLVFVNEGHTSHLLGVSKTASQNLLNYLYDLVKTPEAQARFEWKQGDIAVWDNRQVQHYAARDYGAARRRIHRVTLEHDGVF